MRGARNESEMLGGAASRNSPETVDKWFEAMLSTASLISVLCCACSKISAPTSVSRRFRVDRSINRTPSCSSRSATRRLTVEVGILRRRAASEKLLASTTLAKIISEFRSVIETFCAFRSWPQNATLHGRGLLKDYPKCGKIICSLAHYSHRPQWDYVRLGKKY